MRVAVLGSGYVGLVAAAGFSDSGNDVVCIDVDAERIARLREGKLPIYEPGLDVLVQENVAAGRLRFATSRDELGDREVIFVAVGTPALPDGTAQLAFVEAAARDIAATVRGYTVVAVKSTVPPGTVEHVQVLIRAATEVPVDVVANPEFLAEGSAVNDFMRPSRVILGTTSERAVAIMRDLYAPYFRRRERLLVMSPRSAELTKYATNAMLATRISFMNDLARLCERIGADIEDIRHGLGTDPRIGDAFLFAGVGYGGSCLPKDISALLRLADDRGTPLELVRAVSEVNRRQRVVLVERVLERFGKDLAGRRFAVWGLAFKPGTDDVREAPALEVIRRLAELGATVVAYDPKAGAAAKQALGAKVEIAASAYDACRGAHGLLVLTEWKEFRSPDFDRIRSLLAEPVVFDGRNLYDSASLRARGLEHFAIGR